MKCQRGVLVKQTGGNGYGTCGKILKEAEVYYLATVEAYPSLKSMYVADDENTQVFYFKNAKATISAFTHAPEVITFQ